MKKIFSIILCASFVSCNPVTGNDKAAATDSTNGVPEYVVKQQIKNSLDSELKDKIYFNDTSAIQDAPVIVLSATPVEQDYSNYKNIRLKYKNVSGKNISAIKFRWYGLNAFGDPAEMGTSLSDYDAGIGAGFTDDLLKVGKSTTSTFDISSKDLKKVIKAWPFEVVFEDGTKWKLGPTK